MASMGWIKLIPIAILWIKRIIIAILMITMSTCILKAFDSSERSIKVEWTIRRMTNDAIWKSESAREKYNRAMETESLSNSLTIHTQITSLLLSWTLIFGLLIALINQFHSTLKKNEALKRIEPALIELKDKNVS